ncbi:hypothetical protein C8F04DRAFT_1308904 [Mycena alexandri]|uniref:Uncharacterized protein n=1 Tax=Mycena alexandri TaxID=1745969 RepID=A0AAD6TNK9_9AGAR|nr:hypothetical protein C8F04DRAFT_1308904 [Mycena alexandri]
MNIRGTQFQFFFSIHNFNSVPPPIARKTKKSSRACPLSPPFSNCSLKEEDADADIASSTSLPSCLYVTTSTITTTPAIRGRQLKWLRPRRVHCSRLHTHLLAVEMSAEEGICELEAKRLERQPGNSNCADRSGATGRVLQIRAWVKGKLKAPVRYIAFDAYSSKLNPAAILAPVSSGPSHGVTGALRRDNAANACQDSEVEGRKEPPRAGGRSNAGGMGMGTMHTTDRRPNPRIHAALGQLGV